MLVYQRVYCIVLAKVSSSGNFHGLTFVFMPLAFNCHRHWRQPDFTPLRKFGGSTSLKSNILNLKITQSKSGTSFSIHLHLCVQNLKFQGPVNTHYGKIHETHLIFVFQVQGLDLSIHPMSGDILDVNFPSNIILAILLVTFLGTYLPLGFQKSYIR